MLFILSVNFPHLFHGLSPGDLVRQSVVESDVPGHVPDAEPGHGVQHAHLPLLVGHLEVDQDDVVEDGSVVGQVALQELYLVDLDPLVLTEVMVEGPDARPVPPGPRLLAPLAVRLHGVHTVVLGGSEEKSKGLLNSNKAYNWGKLTYGCTNTQLIKIVNALVSG